MAVMLAVAVGGYLLSIGADVPQAFTFPKSVIYVMVVMAIIQLIMSVIAARKIGPVLTKAASAPYPWKKVATALVCVIVYFMSMEAIGFYFSGFLFFLITSTLLQKEEFSLKSCAWRTVSAGAFMAALFVLFNVILTTQMPKGLTM
ncbi:MAG: tripartite tricarboxylate transporter TctB family protein [Desulfobacterales bacterium]|nr:tripartite tricarboxylate transporter TctB family protein [Desulfobacterales bacterium]